MARMGQVYGYCFRVQFVVSESASYITGETIHVKWRHVNGLIFCNLWGT